jgi:peptidoglycan/LPS O-acetylase OafA/YrhL
MGTIRFLFAAAVVLGHAPGWGFLVPKHWFMAPYYAVQCFFVISGFYMALVHERYAGQLWVFYTNRYSRLIVPYLIVAAVTLLFAPFPFWPAGFVPGPLLGFVNISMIGLDTLQFFQRCPGNCFYWIVPQSWSLGTEIWFYLLVPFLVPMKTRTLCVLLAASVALRFAIASTDLPFFPWQQRFFPTELAFFLIGMLAFRIRVSEKMGWPALVVAILLVAFSNIHRLSAWISLGLAAALFLLIPPIFELTKRSAIDRFIGEFSYPVYLWHVVIGEAFQPAQRLWHGWLLLLLSILASLPIVLFIERPMEQWRNRRLLRAKAHEVEVATG